MHKQLERFSSILEHAYNKVPFYADTGRSRRVPIVDKNTILKNLGAFLDRTLSDVSDLSSVLKHGSVSPSPEVSFGREVVIEQTSGSSGVPFRIAKTVSERRQAALGIWKQRMRIDPAATLAAFHALIHAPAGQASPGPGENLFSFLARRRVRWIHATPHLLQRYADACEEHSHVLVPTLRYLESSGASLAESDRHRIEQCSKAVVVDQYGCREVWAIGMAKSSDIFLPVEDNVIVEIVDEGGGEIVDCGVRGRIIVTSLLQKLMPFIRYDTGDSGEWVHSEDGKRGIRLAGGRPFLEIVGSAGVRGDELFKSIMIRVYRQVGYPSLTILQIRQLSFYEFDVIISDCAKANEIVLLMEIEFNRREVLKMPATFARSHKSADELAVAAGDKGHIFTNMHFTR